MFLQGIFSKRFNNFSFEVINLLTGLDKANDVFPVGYILNWMVTDFNYSYSRHVNKFMIVSD